MSGDLSKLSLFQLIMENTRNSSTVSSVEKWKKSKYAYQNRGLTANDVRDRMTP
jgi:hypothetical protein